MTIRVLSTDISSSNTYIVDMAELLGTFEQVVLLSVLGLENEAYGRSVLREVQSAIHRRAVSAGAVYATLDRLETKRLLSSRLAKVAQNVGAGPDVITSSPRAVLPLSRKHARR